MTPRGIRNNNPGNIRRSPDAWLGLAAEQTDPKFFRFNAPLFGIRALAVILRNYQRKHGLKTIREVIGRWAPSSENDTEAYVTAVARATGLAADAALDLEDPATLAALVEAVIEHENGEQPYSDALIEQAVASALS